MTVKAFIVTSVIATLMLGVRAANIISVNGETCINGVYVGNNILAVNTYGDGKVHIVERQQDGSVQDKVMDEPPENSPKEPRCAEIEASMPKFIFPPMPFVPPIQLPFIGMPNFSQINIPNIFRPNMPNISLPKKPKVVMPQMPKIVMPQMPKVVMPQMPTFYMPQLPQIVIPEMPKLVMPEMPQFVMPEMPKLVMPQMAQFLMPEMPKFVYPKYKSPKYHKNYYDFSQRYQWSPVF